jgi:hypothetical protein
MDRGSSAWQGGLDQLQSERRQRWSGSLREPIKKHIVDRDSLEQSLRCRFARVRAQSSVIPSELIAKVVDLSLQHLQQGRLGNRDPQALTEYAFKMLQEFYVKQSLAGSYRIEHRGTTRSAAPLWQPSIHGLVELIIVPDIALFEASCAVTLDRIFGDCSAENLVQLDELRPKDDGSVVFYLQGTCLHPGRYVLMLMQSNACGGRRMDRFMISVVNPNHPPLRRGMALCC